MNTSEIEAFLAILQHGNLTEASKSLFISQSTLSHRLAELEKKIGMILIERGRGGKSLTLTHSGKQFLLIAQRWENLMQDTKQLQLQLNELSLTIGAVDSFHLFIFPRLYQALINHTPKINLNLKTYNSAELYLLVDRGEIDVGFTLLDLPMRNITVEKIYSEPRVVLFKEENPTKTIKNGFVQLNDLDPNKEIFFVGDNAYHIWYQQWKKGKEYPSLQVDTTQLLLLLMTEVQSWSVVPLCIARELVLAGPYSYSFLDNAPSGRTCYKIHSKYLPSNTTKGLEILDLYLDKILGQGNQSNPISAPPII